MTLHRGRHMLILGWVEIVTDHRLGCRHRGLIQSLADQTLLGLSGTQRRVSNGKEHDADVLDQIVCELGQDAAADKRIVAATTGKFMKGPAMSWPDHGHVDGDEKLARFDGGLKQIDEKIIGGTRRVPSRLAISSSAPIASVIAGNSDAGSASETLPPIVPSVADRRMRDVRRRLAKERRMPGDQGIGQHLAVPGERADTQPVALQLDAAKCRDMGDVDQRLRGLQSASASAGTRLWPPAI